MRLFSMESLGFFDPPEQSWTTPPSVVSEPGPTETTSQITELFEIPVGKHTRRPEPTGELVKDMWDSTELHAPSLLDWAPETISSRKLGRRNFRWPVVLTVVAGTLAVAWFGYWMYTRPDSSAAAAMAQVEAEAARLVETFDEAAPLIDDLDSERLADPTLNSTVFFDMGEAARAMFSASAGLPASDSADRSAAADAAGLALDASGQLMDATAYRTALEPSLTLPLLETDPALTDLTTATAAFTEWRAGFEEVHEALPTGLTGHASAAVDELSATLDGVQASYLDALRLGDRAGAVAALGGLREDLMGVRTALVADMSEITATVTALVEQARGELSRLLG
jgi:hypothetical protein